MGKVLVVIPVEERHKKILEEAGKGLEFVYSSYKTVTEEDVAEAEVIIGNVPAKWIKASDKLKLLQLNSAGTDGYTTPGVLHTDTLLCNSTGAYSKAVAEHCFGMMFMLQKKLHRYRDYQKKHEWTDLGQIVSPADATILVVGLGDIGLHYARMAKALGAYVIGVKRRPTAFLEGVDEIYTTECLDELLPRADVVVNFLPGTPATYHLFTKERFELMKNTAFFINGGRGNAVASEVLYEAVKTGQIAGAGIDVTEPEPLPADSPLWDLEDVIITPHISGQFHLQETFERIVGIAAYNLKSYVDGTPVKNEVDFETGYKK